MNETPLGHLKDSVGFAFPCLVGAKAMLCLLFTLIFPIQSGAQNEAVNIKSIKSLIASSNRFESSDANKAHRYAEQAYDEAKKLGDDYMLALATKQIAVTTLLEGKTRESLLLFESAIKSFKMLGKEHDCCMAYNNMGGAYYYLRDVEKAEQSFKESVACFERNNDMPGIVRAKANLALVFMETHESAKALTLLDDAIRYFESTGNEYSMSVNYINKGNVYLHVADYPNSLENFLKGLKIFEKLNNFQQASVALNNIALLYMAMGDFESALRYYLRILENPNASSNPLLNTRISTSIGGIYAELGNYERALEYLDKSLEMSRLERDTLQEIHALNNKCDLFVKMGKFGDALEISQQAMELASISIESSLLANTLGLVAEILQKAPDEVLWAAGFDPKFRYHLAIEKQKERIAIAEKQPLIVELRVAWKSISELYEKAGDYTNAYSAYQKFIHYKETFTSDEVKKQVARYEIQYEFDKKEAVIRLEQQLLASQLEQQRRRNLTQEQSLLLERQRSEISRLALLKEKAERQEQAQALKLAENGQQLKTVEVASLTKDKALQAEILARQRFLMGLFFVSFLAMVLGATALYFWQRQHRNGRESQRQAQFSQQLLQSTEFERTRIARELHDSVSHDLLVLKRELLQASEGEREPAHKIDDILENVRNISRNLHPVMLDSIGLKHSLETLCEQFAEQESLFVAHDIAYEGGLSKQASLHVFRIVQEALTNTAKYAEAAASRVRLCDIGHHISLEIKDNGKGFDVAGALASGQSFGLHSILQRCKAIGCSAHIESSGSGTVITAQIPKNS